MSQSIYSKSLIDLPKVLWKLSIAFAVIIAFTPPIGYWFATHHYESDHLQRTADQVAHAVSQHAYVHPDGWDLQAQRLAHIVSDYRYLGEDLSIQILDLKGESILPGTPERFVFSMSRDASVTDGKRVVGSVVIKENCIKTIGITAVIGLVSILLAISVLSAISRYSIRGMKVATTRIDQAYGQLEQQSRYLYCILASSKNVGIVATDSDWIIQYSNNAARMLFNCPDYDALSFPLFRLNDELGKHISYFQERLQGDDATSTEYTFTIKVGEGELEKHIDARISPIIYEREHVSGYTLICSDITDQHKAAELIKYQATYDNLTGLPNRRMFYDLLAKSIARAKRHEHIGAILFMDLDTFKHINDSLGHAVGDELLQQAARRMELCLREEDTVARLGGDEFVVVAPEIADDYDTSVAKMQELAGKIQKTLSEPYDVEPHVLHVTSSVGISIFPNDDESGATDVMRQADTAMYRAKAAGRNSVRFFLPIMQHAADERLRILGDLRQAITNEEFVPYFQPQFDEQGNMFGAEALIRWKHPEQGLVMPDQFIPVAEENEVILKLGDFMMRSCLSIVRGWVTSGQVSDDFRVAINVSPQQFKQADFIEQIDGVVTDSGVVHSNLTLELTESFLLENMEDAIEKISALKERGVRMSLDDFGTGYSSLAYLKRLPIDEIKIDRSFIRDVLNDESDAALIETILNLSDKMKLHAIAEGVETTAQYNRLKTLGCSLFQGYFFSKPLPQSEFEEFVMSTASEVV